MSHGGAEITVRDVPAIVLAEPFKISAIVRIVLWLLVVVGVGGFAAGVLGADAKLAWTALQVNFIYWYCVAAAASCFGAAFHISNAQWARPIQRLFEASSDFFMYSLLPLVVLYFGKEHLFIWATETIPGKEGWLSPKFVYVRDFVAIALLVILAKRLVYLSLQRDIGAIRRGLTGIEDSKLARWKSKSYDRYLQGFSTDAQVGLKTATDEMGRLSPWLVVIYAVMMSVVAFDQVMSVDPHWYSTLFGAFIFMTAVYVAMAWNSIGVWIVRRLHPLFCQNITRKTLHDLGKLLFGFGIFWAYLFWSHYLTIWYGNIPEETGWVIVRLRQEPWHTFSWFVFGLCFIIPFLLGLSRDLKQVPVLLASTGVIVAIGVWGQGYMLFVPTSSPDRIPLNCYDLAVALGFFGAYALSVASFLGRVPLIPFGDLYQPVVVKN